MLFVTPPLTVITVAADSAHHVKGRAGHQPGFIVLHHTGGADSRAWLSKTSVPPVSTQRLISKAGTIYKIVADEDTAYTAGYGLIGPIDPDTSDPPGVAPNLNYASLNIELENAGTGRDPYPAAQVQSCALQIVEWWGKYGFLPIVSHAQVDSRKTDPLGFDWQDLYRRMWALLRGIGGGHFPPAATENLRRAAAASQLVTAELTAVLASVTP